MASVSIVIPAFNEEKRLPVTLEKIQEYLEKKDFSHEIIIVDDGSTDNTKKSVECFEKLNIKVIPNEKNTGKGYSINRGILAAKNDIILFTDADLSTPIKFLDNFLAMHKKGYDVVIASRAINRKLVKKHQPFIREAMGRIFNIFVLLITGLKIKDTQCGFKSFTKKAAKDVFPRQTIFDFGFDVEILYIASARGFKIYESAAEWYDSPGTKVSPFRDSVRMFIDLFKIKYRSIKDFYK